MKRSLYILMPVVFALHALNASALEIDEKLTLRFLNVSSTKKTVLINRGGEDGLIVGNHAKFFITAGVVARGVAEKVSPSRSVWSLYRIVDPEEIVQDKVLNLKIATPVKITDDPSRSLKEEAIPGGTESMGMGDEVGVEKTSATNEVVVNDAEKDELKELGIDEEGNADVVEKSKAQVSSTAKSSGKGSAKKPVIQQVSNMDDVTTTYSTNTSRTWEAWGTMYINSLSGTTEDDSGSGTASSISSVGSTVDFSAGIEKYFVNYNNFFKEVSLSVFLHKKTIENGDSIKTKADWFEYGVGANYHFYNSAAAVNRLIGYGTVTLGKGSATIESKVITSGTETGDPVKGTNSFFSAGLGAKYVLSNGFGLRAVLDYYSSSETYEFDTGSTTRKLAGPRVQFGLSYRF